VLINDLTVIYYTSNREKPEFEGRIQQSLLDTIGDLPLISVSQKPIDFGENVCVGDIGVSSENAWRQFQIGAKQAKTKYVCCAESDSLYTKEYFNFRPQKSDVVYTPFPVFVLFALRSNVKIFVRKRRYTDFGIFTTRNHIINVIEKYLSNPETKYITKTIDHEEFDLEIPVVTFKTDNNMHRKTAYTYSTRKLDYWGKSHDLIAEYL